MSNSPAGRKYIGSATAWFFALALFGYEIVAGIGAVTGIATANVSIAYRALVLAAAVSVVFARLGTGSIRVGPGHLLFGLFALVYVVRLLADTIEPSGALFFPAWTYWMWAGGACLIPALAVSQLEIDPELGRSMRRAVFLVAALAAALALLSTRTEFAELAENQAGRFRLPSLNPISMGHMGGSVMLLAIWQLFAMRRRDASRRSDVLAIAAAIAGAFLLIVSNSRGPLVAVAFALLVLGTLLPLRRAVLFFAGLVWGALSFGSVAAYLEAEHGYTTYSRLFGQSQLYEVNTLDRLQRFSYAWDAILEKPVLGAGIEVPVYGGYPHNILLEAAMSVGFYGAALLLALVLIAALRAFLMVRADSTRGWLLVLFVQYFMATQFSYALYQATHFWLLLGALLGLVLGPKVALLRRPRAIVDGTVSLAGGEAR